jgi:hypothetical protein
MKWIFGLYVAYGLVQINLKTVDKACGTPCQGRIRGDNNCQETDPIQTILFRHEAGDRRQALIRDGWLHLVTTLEES